MTKYITLLCAFVVPFFTNAQAPLSKGAQLLFANTASKLSAAEKDAIFKQTGFLLSADKKQFIQDKEGADFPFDAIVYTTDLNKDGNEEVFIEFGNSYTSGQAGSSIELYIKNNAGQYGQNLGFPGIAPDVLATSSGGYLDLLIGGPGFEFPIWRWNGKEYSFYKKVKEAEYNKLKKTPLADVSNAYKKSIQ